MRGFLDLLTITFVGKFSRRPMHFFGSWGVIWFLLGFGLTARMVWDKIDSVFISGIPLHREVTDQPIFYLALVAILIGVQLFLTGFLAELFTGLRASKKDYFIIERVNID